MAGRKKFLTWGGLIIALVLLLAFNLFSNAAFTSSRLDLTRNQLYTLSSGTKSILSELTEPVTLRLFLSQQQATRLPGISNYTQRVRELLEEYQRQADGKITLHIVDPEPFSEAEDRAVDFGVQGIPLGQDGATFYFGLAGTNSTDGEQVIPFFALEREKLLEHDLTRLIYQLSVTESGKIGLLSSLPLDGGPPDPQALAMGLNQGLPQPWVIREQIQQLFEITDIDPAAGKIPADIDVLMVVHPKQLSDNMLYAIDQFVLDGGRALVFVDPNAEVDRDAGMMGMASPPGSSNLEPLFSAWGIELVDGKVAGDLTMAERVRYGQQQNPSVIDYPVWMNLALEQNNDADVVTANLGNLMFATPGILHVADSEQIEVLPLVTTSTNAMQYDVAQVQFVDDPGALLAGYTPGGEEMNLAVRITGRIDSAFPDGPPPASEGDEPVAGEDEVNVPDARAETEPHRQQSAEDVNLIVVADTDMLADEFWAQVQNILGSRLIVPTAANGDFVINSLESLLGSNDLISVRSRGEFSRPFTLVAQIQRDAEVRFRQKELELLAALEDTERKILDLEQGGLQAELSDQPVILSEAQLDEIEKFRDEKIRIRKDLRQVRHQLREDIERLESVTKFANIGFVPILIGLGGLFIGLRKLRGGKRREHDRGEHG